MNVKIKSTVAKIPTRENGNAYLSREIIKLDFDLTNKTFQPIIKEEIYIISNNEILVVEPVTILKPKVFSKTEVDSLFNSMNTSINSDGSFTNDFLNLLGNALLLETQNYTKTLYGIAPEEWVLSI